MTTTSTMAMTLTSALLPPGGSRIQDRGLP